VIDTAKDTVAEQNVPLPPSRQAPRPVAAVIIVSVLCLVIIGLSIWYLTRREPLVVQGEVQCRTFDMAARVDGRVAQISVSRSQNVKQSTPIIRIDNPELVAKYAQSEADLRVAEAELTRVKAGFRAETRCSGSQSRTARWCCLAYR
jgi:HlyD family secretion protein